ncbi:MAG: LUD domain-containing protein [Urechidicola sp.]|nr:LUD domain-containing protein [Urechidicola sp.]
MKFLKKIFKSLEDKKQEGLKEQQVELSLDDSFVHNFIKLGGKFLYCQSKKDVTKNLQHILEENNWDIISTKNADLNPFISSLKSKIKNEFNNDLPFFTDCEFLISENGSLLFSSNQLEDKKLASLTKDFIVFATTSQIVKSKDESLTGIKIKYGKDLPTNISPIKNYNLNTTEDNFLNYGTNNSKNLYLLLLEDL